MRWTKRWAKRLRALVRRDAVERELDEELAFHLEMETRKNERAGMSPAEARRRAALAFGGVEKFKEEVRDARMLGWVSGASLDFKLGARMIARYPGLTVVAGMALAFAIALGAATFELVTQLVHPRLPLHDGAAVVGIRVWDTRAGREEDRLAADVLAWRGELRSVREIGAFRTLARNLIVPGGSAEPVPLAEMSAAGFRVARVAPRMGRYLVEDDERPGAPAVAVLGYELWRSRFAGDPGVVGRQVRLGNDVHTVVGVMPRGFRFPLAEQLWVPLRLDGPGAAQGIRVFGRLAPGATLAGARAEIATLGRRAAAASPRTHRYLRPGVLPYARSILGMEWRSLTTAAYSSNAAVVLFLALVCANVATLIFARTASRESELVVRTALGASRGRIVAQLFAETLVLSAVAGAVGLAGAAFGLRWGMGVFQATGEVLPFWFHPGLSLRTILYTVLLAVLAAAMAGVIPALKMTGKGAERRLRQTAVGGSSLRFGRVWTGIIVTQVALTAALVPIVTDTVLDTREIRSAPAGFAVSEFLTARLTPEGERGDSAAADARLRASYAELKRRLEAEPLVRGVTFGEQMPGGYHPRRVVEVDGVAPPPGDAAEQKAQVVSVAPDFFGVLGAPIVLGRGFAAGDARPGGRVVVVNESFVRELMGGGNAIGRRVRYRTRAADEDGGAAAPGPWYEIVGVVRELGLTVDPDLPHAGGIYHPAEPSAAAPFRVAVHLRGAPDAFAPRLRALTAAVDPTLSLSEVHTAYEARRETLETYEFWVRLACLACGVVMLLASFGIYSVLAFTVARRTREIGIRVALGASGRRVVASIFRKAFMQVGLGIAAGVLLLVVLTGGIHSMRGVELLSAGVAIMGAAAVAACIVPARRALAIPPTEAMRADA